MLKRPAATTLKRPASFSLPACWTKCASMRRGCCPLAIIWGFPTPRASMLASAVDLHDADEGRTPKHASRGDAVGAHIIKPKFRICGVVLVLENPDRFAIRLTVQISCRTSVSLRSRNPNAPRTSTTTRTIPNFGIWSKGTHAVQNSEQSFPQFEVRDHAKEGVRRS